MTSNDKCFGVVAAIASRLALVTVLMSGSTFAQKTPVKIALTPSSNVSNADIVKNMTKHCPSVTVTIDALRADLTLEAVVEAIFAGGVENRKFKFTLFDKEETAVFNTSTRYVSNAVKDVCKYIESRK